MDSLAFLDRSAKSKVQPIYVLHGDDVFLKSQVLTALRTLVLGAEGQDAEFGLTRIAGDKAVWASVLDELQTLPFFGPRRLVLIENADPFVSEERARLEKYVVEPASGGVLVLDVTSWSANTRLAKLVPDAGTLVCKAPKAERLPEWCRVWSRTKHGKEILVGAAQMLVELIGPEMGLLDQELAKLAAYVGSAATIRESDVDALVGNRRSEYVWKIFDLIGAGDAGAALALLDSLLSGGEDVFRLLGAFSSQLRRIAQAGRLINNGSSIGQAIEQVGVPPFGRRAAEAQLRHLGRRRVDRLFDWLIQTDLGFKGDSALSERTQLERLLVLLARKEATASARN